MESCTVDGYKVSVCEICGNKAIIKTNAPGHLITEYDVKIDATCETDGKESGYCDVCAEYVSVVIPAMGHVQGEFSYEDDYCGEQRLGVSTCTRCFVVLQSFGHTYKTTVIDETCTTDGEKIHTCTNCNYSYSETVRSRGHVLGEWVPTTDATCSVMGVETIFCIVCEEPIQTRLLPMREHIYESVATADGITYTCALCSDSYVVETAEQVTVSFITVLDGVSCAPLTVEKGAQATLPTPVKNGYIFNGWYFDEAFKYKCESNQVFSSDVTLFASWNLSVVEGSASTDNLITDVGLDFTFRVKSDIVLTDENITDYVSVSDVNGRAPKLYLSSSEGNVYIVSSSDYRYGMGYEVVAGNEVTLIGVEGNHLMFVTESDNSADVRYRDGVIFIPESEVFAVYESEDGRIYFFFRSDVLDVDDVAVIYGDGGVDDVLITMKVVREGDTEGAYVYEAEAASPDDVFEECDVYFSGELETDSLEFTANLEEEIVNAVESSALYAQMRIAARKYAMGFETGNYYYEFSNIKITPTFTNDKNSDRITLIVELTTEFERLHTETREVDSILAITLKMQSVFAIDATVNVSGVRNFTLVLNVDNSTSIDLYVSRGEKNESKTELSYFKEMFLNAKEDGAFEALDSSSAGNSRELPLGNLVFTFGGISFRIEVTNVFSFEAVGQLGLGADIKMNISAGVQCRNGDVSAVKSFNAHSTLNFYMVGKLKLSDTVKFKASVSFLGVVNAYVDVEAAPYFEMGGTAMISVSTGGGFSADIGGYVEMGVSVKASAGVNAKISYWRMFKGWKTKTLFDKSWVLYKQDFILFEMGDYLMTLYFTDKEEEITVQYVCGESVALSELIDRTVVEQNLKTMSKTYGFADCTYYIESGSRYVTLGEDGMLTVIAGDYDSVEIRVRVEHKNVFKTVYITITFNHNVVTDAAVAPNCTETGLTEGSHCSGCNEVLVAQSVIDALGHKVVVDGAVAPTCPSSGLTEGSHCSVCGEVFVAQTVIPPLGYHVYEVTVTVPTCTDGGYTLHECLCGDFYYTDMIDALGHDFDKGLCARCGVEYTGYTKGLSYQLSSNGSYYSVVGIGECEESVIEIAPRYNGLPVTQIGYQAFSRCDYITEIIIPDTVTVIGSSAFSQCRGLISVVIPEGVTSIGSNAFENCSGLVSVTISSSVSSIGSSAFKNCYKLVEVINHGSMSITTGTTSNGYVGNYARTVHSGESVIVNKSGYLFAAFDGVNYLLGYVGDDLILVLPESYNGESYEIYKYAFYHDYGVVGITLPAGVSAIGDHAFEYCYRLIEVINNTSLEIKLNSSTHGYVSSYAKAVHTGESVLVNSNGYIFITADGANYFMGYDGASVNLNLPELYSGEGYEIYKYAFYGSTKIKSVYMPSSVTGIGAYAFYNCLNLNSVDLSASMTKIGDYAFYRCRNLGSISLPNSITSIGSMAFCYCESIKNVSLPINLTKISSNLFYGCTGLESVEIYSGVSAIENYAFYGCSSLTSVELPDSITKIGDNVFENCSGLTSVNLPESLTGIGNSMFSGCSSLAGITLPSGLTSIGRSAFSGCKSLTSILIPDGVNTIGSGAFNACENITSIVIPSGVTVIDGSTFNGCTRLASVTIPDGVTRIGSMAFGGTKGLVSIVIPDSVTVIDSLAFNGATGLVSISIPGSVTSIGSNAFYGCTGLKSVVIGDGVTTISRYAFSNCTALESVIIPDSVTEIGDGAFYRCTSMTDVTIGGGITAINASVFSGCKSLSCVVIPSAVTSIGDYAFSDSTGLVSVTLGSGVASISDTAFANCPKLVEVINLSTLEIAAGATDNGNVAYNAKMVHAGESIIDNRDGFLFVTLDGVHYLLGYKGDPSHLVLPEYYDGESYVIYNHAFSSVMMYTMVLPKSVTVIEESAIYSSLGYFTLYYTGTPEDWQGVSVASGNYSVNGSTIRYYSETEPTDSRKYWHYVDGEIVIWS